MHSYEKYELIYSSPDGRVKVHRGYSQTLQKVVALKLQLHPSLAEANLTLREGLNQASLKHPNICEVYDCQVKELAFEQVETTLVTEFMEEGDLMKEIERRMRTAERWSEGEILDILTKIVVALVYAQANGICHRDIKPQNVFLRPPNEIKLGDFGSSTSFARADSVASFSLQGSPFYLSPELKACYIHYLTHGVNSVRHDPYKSDVYSLGVMVLLMVRLQTPLLLSNLGNLRKNTETLLEECTEYPKVQKILRGMLEVTPENRIGLVELVRKLRNTEQIATNSDAGKTRFCVICQKGLQASSASYSSTGHDTCSLACEKRLIAADFDRCVVCSLPRTQIPAKMYTVVLPCGHFYHHIGCFYAHLSEKSSGFSHSVDYKCKKCNVPIPYETLEDVFSADQHSADISRLRIVKKCCLCHNRPAVVVLECGHVRCTACASRIDSPCKCMRVAYQSNCVLS